MKQLISYCGSTLLFWAGHLVSKAMHMHGMWWLYPLYHWLMSKSVDVDDWAGGMVWQRVFDPTDVQSALRSCGGPLFP